MGEYTFNDKLYNKLKSNVLKVNILNLSRDDAKIIYDDYFKFRSIERINRYNSGGARNKIEQYKKIMKNNKWDLFHIGEGEPFTKPFVHDPLIFKDSGILFEGKHRIIALSELETNIVIPFFVILGFNMTLCKRFWKYVKDRKERGIFNGDFFNEDSIDNDLLGKTP